MPEFIDPVFAKTSQKRSFSVIQNEHFMLVFANTGSIISGTEKFDGPMAGSKSGFIAILYSKNFADLHKQICFVSDFYNLTQPKAFLDDNTFGNT